jgi:hypothetical protein
LAEPKTDYVVRPRPGASQGQWNAYVSAGTTRDIRRERLEECPAEFRAAVESHVRTVWQIRARKQAMKGKAQEQRARYRGFWEPEPREK